MVKYLIYSFPIVFLIVPIIILLCLKVTINKRDMTLDDKGQGGVVQYPRWVFILGLAGSIVFVVLLINNFETEKTFGRIFFTSFIFIANCLMYVQLSYRIYYGNGNITYIVFWRKREYRVEDVANIEERKNSTIIRFKNGAKIDFDSNLCQGDINFIRYLNGLPPIEM